MENTGNTSPDVGATENASAAQEAAIQKELYKLRVDDQELEVDLDELKRGYTHRAAADKRMQEASMTRKEAEQVLRMFKENPREALKHLGIDPRSVANSWIEEDLAEALLTPQERELRDYKAQLAKYQSQEKAAREQYEREQYEAQMNQMAQTLQTDIINVLETTGLPKNDRTVQRMAYYMQTALNAGFENVTPADVVEYVKADYKADIQSLMGSLDEDAIEAFLGSDNIKRIAKSTVKTSKNPPIVPRSINENRQPRESSEQKVRSPDQFFRKIRGR